MGIVDLKENKQDGRYAVEVVRDLERAKQFKAKMTEAIDKLKADIEEKTKDIAPAEEKVISAANEYNAEILVLQDRAVILEQMKDDLEVKQNTVTGLQTQLNIKSQEKQSIEDALTNPGLTPEQIADLQAQLAIVNDQIDDLTDQLNALNADIADTVARIEELQDPKKQLKKVNELTEKFLEIAAERDKIKNEILFLDLSKTAKEKRLTEYEAIINEVDARDIWCVDYETTLEPVQDAENHLVSIEINDDPTLILLAPRTYTPTGEDVDELTTIVSTKQAEFNKLDVQFDAYEVDLESANARVDEKRQEILDERAFITTIPIDTSKAERERLILESNARLKILEEQFIHLAGTAVAITDKLNSLQAKKSLLAQVISRLGNERNKLSAVLSSVSGILVPEIDAYTTQLQPTQSSGPSAVFYNKALLPGYQKWFPTFRIGTITAIDGDLCNVSLDDATSSQQKLDINQQKSLVNVPIKYGNCNGAVFEVGDNIVVEFKGRDATKPVVIGFQDHPRACGGIVVLPSSGDAPNGWGKPLKDSEGILINPPLGSAGGSDPQYVFTFTAPPDSIPRIVRNIPQSLGGNCHNSGDKLISWDGPFGFNIAPPVLRKSLHFNPITEIPGYETQLSDIGVINGNAESVAVFTRFSNKLYEGGKEKTVAPGEVLGASYFGTSLVCVVSISRLKDAIYVLSNNNQWELVGDIDFVESPGQFICNRNHCYWFSESGDSIVSHITSIEQPNAWVLIPRVKLKKSQIDDTILIDFIAIEQRLNCFQFTEQTVSDKSISDVEYDSNNEPAMDYQQTYTQNVAGNSVILLGIGYFGDIEKEITVRVINHNYSSTASGVSGGRVPVPEFDSYTLQSSSVCSANINIEYRYELSDFNGTKTICTKTLTGQSTGIFAQSGFSGLTKSFTENLSYLLNEINLTYFNIDKEFHVYVNTVTDWSLERIKATNGLVSKTKNISKQILLYTSNKDDPVVIYDDTYFDSTSSPINHPAEVFLRWRTIIGHSPRLGENFVYSIFPHFKNATASFVGDIYIYDEYRAHRLTGCVDKHGNGVFQFKTEVLFFLTGMVDELTTQTYGEFYDSVILPKDYTVQSLTEATGDNPRLANINILFQNDEINNYSQIFAM